MRRVENCPKITMKQSPKFKQSSTQRPVVASPVVNPTLGERAETLVINGLESLDQILYKLMGDWGRIIYACIQDAIVLIILLKIPSLILEIILHKNLSNFQVCSTENIWSLSRYACFFSVTANFLLWIVLAGRIIARFWAGFKKLQKDKT
jgi:hypothetical protein